jgi:hypothetical protein
MLRATGRAGGRTGSPAESGGVGGSPGVIMVFSRGQWRKQRSRGGQKSECVPARPARSASAERDKTTRITFRPRFSRARRFQTESSATKSRLALTLPAFPVHPDRPID